MSSNKGRKTGTRPSGNTKGMQGANMAPANPRSAPKASSPASILASGKGPKSGKKQS